MKNVIIGFLIAIILVVGGGFILYVKIFQSSQPSISSINEQQLTNTDSYNKVINYLTQEGIIQNSQRLQYVPSSKDNGIIINIKRSNLDGSFSEGGIFFVTRNSISVDVSGNDTPQYIKVADINDNTVLPVGNYPSSQIQQLGYFLYKN